MSFENEASYEAAQVCSFRKTKEAFGGLSNMAAGYPLRIGESRLLTSEALYQACRFPHLSDVQREIIAQKSPMSAKMKAKPHKADSREDWDAVCIDVMRWCLNAKLAFHFKNFGNLLGATAGKDIVEDSHKDTFWGAVRTKDSSGVWVGRNVLGKLLMELRTDYLAGNYEALLLVEPPRIADFLLLGKPIETIDLRHKLRRLFG